MFTDGVSLLWPNDMEKLEVSLDLETWPLNQCLESEHVTIATKLEHGGKSKSEIISCVYSQVNHIYFQIK